MGPPTGGRRPPPVAFGAPPPMYGRDVATLYIRATPQSAFQANEAHRALKQRLEQAAGAPLVDLRIHRERGFAHADFDNHGEADRVIAALDGVDGFRVERSSRDRSRDHRSSGPRFEPPRPPPREAVESATVFVKGFSTEEGPTAIEAMLRAKFAEACGEPPMRVRVGIDRVTNLVKGFAHVDVLPRNVDRALTLTGAPVPDGRWLTVELGKPRDGHAPSAGFGGGGGGAAAGAGAPAPASSAPPAPAPSYGLSGLLAQEANTNAAGVASKYTEPNDAAMPRSKFRLYVFKDGEMLSGDDGVLHLHRQSCFRFGRDEKVADIVTGHSSCSKEHAVLQFRVREGSTTVAPYVIDLGTTNGTALNNERLEPARFYELKHKDMLQFGDSRRQYTLICEDAA